MSSQRINQQHPLHAAIATAAAVAAAVSKSSSSAVGGVGGGPLSYDTVLSRGAVPSKGLQEWLHRAVAVMNTFSPAERPSYAAWAVDVAVKYSQTGQAAWHSVELVPPARLSGGAVPSVPPPPPPLPAAGHADPPLPPHEVDRRLRLQHACNERLAAMYGADANALKIAQAAVSSELRLVSQRVARGELSFFAVGSEAVVQRVLHPHPLPPLPPHLMSRQVVAQPPPPPPTVPSSHIPPPPPPPPPPPIPVHPISLANYATRGKVVGLVNSAQSSTMPPTAVAGGAVMRPRSPVSSGHPDFLQPPRAQPSAHQQTPPPPPVYPNQQQQHQRGGAAAAAVKPVSMADVNARLSVFFPHHHHGAAATNAPSLSRKAAAAAGAPAAVVHFRNVVGSSDALERRYTREAPKAADLRPRAVLPAALAHVLSKAAAIASGNTEVLATSKAVLGQHPAWEGARWLSDQLKGMRQDVQVQRIADAFVVGIYERHARVALCLGDGLEFNQCQSALQRYYARGLRSDPAAADGRVDEAVVAAAAPATKPATSKGGAKSKKGHSAAAIAAPATAASNPLARWTGPNVGLRGEEAVVEFTVCRILYLSLNGLYDTSARECQRLAAASEALRNHVAVHWALRTAAALEARNGHEVTECLEELTQHPQLEATIALSVIGLLAPALQRLRIQWLFSGLHRKALLGTLTSTRMLRRWLGFPALDAMCVSRVVGNVLVGPGHPDANAAWAELWKTLKVPAEAMPPTWDDATAVVDLGLLGTKVMEYSAFLSSSSSGGV